MKKRFALGLLILLAWGGNCYVGYLRDTGYLVYALPLTVLRVSMGICLGLLVWGRMEDLSFRNLGLDAFSLLRLSGTLVMLWAVHLLYQYLGRYGSLVDYWTMLGITAGMNLPGILFRRAYAQQAPGVPLTGARERRGEWT